MNTSQSSVTAHIGATASDVGTAYIGNGNGAVASDRGTAYIGRKREVSSMIPPTTDNSQTISQPIQQPTQPITNAQYVASRTDRFNQLKTQYIAQLQNSQNAGDIIRASRNLNSIGVTPIISYTNEQTQQNNNKDYSKYTQVQNTQTQTSYDPFSQTMPKVIRGKQTISINPYTPNSYAPKVNFAIATFNFHVQDMKTPQTKNVSNPKDIASFNVNINDTQLLTGYDYTKQYTPKVSSDHTLVNMSELKAQEVNLDYEAITSFKKGGAGNIILGSGLALTSLGIGAGKGALGTLEFFSPYSIQQKKFQVPILTPLKDMALSLDKIPAYAKSNPFEFGGMIAGGIATGKAIEPNIPKLKVRTTIKPQENGNFAVIKSLGLEQGKNSFIIGSTKGEYTPDVSFDSLNKFTITTEGNLVEGWKQSDIPSTGEDLGIIEGIFFRNDNPLKFQSPLEYENMNTFVSEVPSKTKISFFSKSPDFTTEIINQKSGGIASEGLRISNPTETKLIQTNYERILKQNPDLLEDPIRATQLIPTSQKIIGSTYNTKSKFTQDSMPKNTKYLDEPALNVVYDIAKNSKKILKNAYVPEDTLTYTGTEGITGIYRFNKKLTFSGEGDSYISGSLSRQPDLAQKYTYEDGFSQDIPEEWIKKPTITHDLNKEPLVVYYHGTRTAEDILKTGLKPANEINYKTGRNWESGKIFLTSDIDIAKFYSEQGSRGFIPKNRPSNVIQVGLTKEEVGRLKIDTSPAFNTKQEFSFEGSIPPKRVSLLGEEFAVSNEDYVLNKVPKDVDLHILGSPKAIQYLADYGFKKLKGLGYDVRQAGEGGIVKNAIEINIPKEGWVKASEFLGEGTIPEADVPPDMLVGFNKAGKKTSIKGIPKTALPEELRGTFQGLLRERKLANGKLDIYPREGRLKDVASVSVSARTLQQSMDAGLEKIKLQRNILKFESFYPEDVVKEQVKLAGSSPKKEIIADYRQTKYIPKVTLSNFNIPKEKSVYSTRGSSYSYSTSKISLSSRPSISPYSSSSKISLSTSKSPSPSYSPSPSPSPSKSPSRSVSSSPYSFSPSFSPSSSPSLSPSPSYSPSPSPSPSKSPSRSPGPSLYPPSKIPKFSSYPNVSNKAQPFKFKLPSMKKQKKGKFELFAIPDLLSVSQTEAYNYGRYGKGEAISPKLTKSVYNQAYLGYKYGQGRVPTMQQQNNKNIWR